MGQIETRLGEIAKLIRSDQDAQALRLHVEQLLESAAFTSSRRSGQFLLYIVNKAIAQETEALKERTIGIEVFRRPANYDTGEDAIVRVTASDVRRRLTQHYSKDGRSSEFRISLPPGGYVPEIYRDTPVHHLEAPASVRPAPTIAPSRQPEITEPQSIAPESHGETFRTKTVRYLIPVLAILALASTYFLLRPHFTNQGPPWSLLFTSGKPLLVIFADPDLNEIQLLTHKYVSLSDYANGRLNCETLEPPLQDVCSHALRGDKVATVDASAITKIAALAERFHANIEPHGARQVRLTDLQTDRNVLLLGSRVSNPWADLFRDKLDFFVDHDEATGLQVVRNVHRRPGEAEVYIPTTGPYGTGDNYTLITFLHNLTGNGYALLLTGATHEGMDAAMTVALDQKQLTHILATCDAQTSPFQVLLKFRMMAGSPLKVETVACHTLTDR